MPAKRLAYRLGLTTNTEPVKIERDLIAAVPRSEWVDLSHRLIHHGRRAGGVLVHCRAGLSRSPAAILAYCCWRGLQLFPSLAATA